MIHLSDSDFKILQSILAQFPYPFYAFGSRVKGTHQPFSDLDMCVMEEIPELTKSYLQEAFENSNITVKVDIIEWNKISQKFRSLIKSDLCLISDRRGKEASG